MACACSSPPRGPYFGDEKLLVVGVDPEAEADSVTHQLERHGFYEVRRLRGRLFTALGFLPTKNETAGGRVRVVTARGIALALDSEPATLLTPGRRVQLLPFPYRDERDLDRDGDEELFVREEPLPAGEPCLRMYRVRQDGTVEEATGDDLVLPRPPDSPDPGFVDVAFCAATLATADAGASES